MKGAEEFFDTATLDKAEQLTEFIEKETPFRYSDITDIPESVIRLWRQLGICNHKESNRLDLVEYVWLNVLAELHRYRLPWAELQQLYLSLARPIDDHSLYVRLSTNPELMEELQLPPSIKNELQLAVQKKEWHTVVKPEAKCSPLMLLVAEAIAKRIPVSIAVFGGGGYLPVVDGSKYLLEGKAQRQLKTHTHIQISITNILSFILGEERFNEVLPQLNMFTTDELNLLALIRSGNYESIKINFQNSRMDLLELEKREDVHKRIVDVLAENQFQSISITQHSGKICKVIRTVKVKL